LTATLFSEIVAIVESDGVSCDVSSYDLNLGSQDVVTGHYETYYVNLPSTLKMPIFPKGFNRLLSRLGTFIRYEAVGFSLSQLGEGDAVVATTGETYRVEASLAVTSGDITVYYENHLTLLNEELYLSTYTLKWLKNYVTDWGITETVNEWSTSTLIVNETANTAILYTDKVAVIAFVQLSNGVLTEKINGLSIGDLTNNTVLYAKNQNDVYFAVVPYFYDYFEEDPLTVELKIYKNCVLLQTIPLGAAVDAAWGGKTNYSPSIRGAIAFSADGKYLAISNTVTTEVALFELT
jgi:hypothetical protein